MNEMIQMIPKGNVVRVYRGKKQIKRLINAFTAIQKEGETVYSLGYEDLFDRALGKNWWWTLRKVRGVHTKFRGVFSWHKKARIPSQSRAKVHYIHAGKGDIEVAIYKDSVRIFSLTKKNPYAILIKDPKISRSFMNYWKVLWKQGKSAKKKLL